MGRGREKKEEKNRDKGDGRMKEGGRITALFPAPTNILTPAGSSSVDTISISSFVIRTFSYYSVMSHP